MSSEHIQYIFDTIHQFKLGVDEIHAKNTL